MLQLISLKKMFQNDKFVNNKDFCTDPDSLGLESFFSPSELHFIYTTVKRLVSSPGEKYDWM